jgi:hypothetical protein
MVNEDTENTSVPGDLQSAKKIALEYVKRLQAIDDEIETLKEDKQVLRAEFKRKVDLKTLDQALKVLKIESEIKHRDAFDTFVEALRKDF